MQVRGENMSERKFASARDRTHNHQVMNLIHSPLSHPGRAQEIEIQCLLQRRSKMKLVSFLWTILISIYSFSPIMASTYQRESHHVSHILYYPFSEICRMIEIEIHVTKTDWSVTAEHCFDFIDMEKQPLVSKEGCEFFGNRNTRYILLKLMLNTRNNPFLFVNFFFVCWFRMYTEIGTIFATYDGMHNLSCIFCHRVI